MLSQPSPDLVRYADLLQHLLETARPFTPGCEPPDALRVDRGAAFPLLLRRPPVLDRPLVDPLLDHAPNCAVVDDHAHRRPPYRGLLIHAFVLAFARARELLSDAEQARWSGAATRWAKSLLASLPSAPPDHAFTAASAATTVESCWTALALNTAADVLDHPAWRLPAQQWFAALLPGQQRNGAFLRSTAADNPEPLAYHELALLHAAASYAARRPAGSPGVDPLWGAICRNAEFHQDETQPDHATTQPWAVFPLLAHAPTRMLAEQILHATQTQHPAGVDALSAILLADALDCLRTCTTRPHATR